MFVCFFNPLMPIWGILQNLGTSLVVVASRTGKIVKNGHGILLHFVFRLSQSSEIALGS